MKKCNRCELEKPLSEFYFHKKESKSKGEYVYYHPYCKECEKDKNAKWRKENPEKRRESLRKNDSKPDRKKKQSMKSKQQKESGYYIQWQQNNKDKLQMYRAYREQHKTHEISSEEWKECKRYFNDSCAYCGISEAKAEMRYKNKLHKDHAFHNGSNKIDNCIPSCKRCNSSKHTKDWDEWYTPELEFYDESRHNLISKWMDY